MDKLSEELVAKIKKAKSEKEIAGLLKADGQDEALAEKLWKELADSREQDVQELSLDELEAVSGGAVRTRDYLQKGCAATVEPDSDCWGTDGGCEICNIAYYNEPWKVKCPVCNKYLAWHTPHSGQCPKCKKVYSLKFVFGLPCIKS